MTLAPRARVKINYLERGARGTDSTASPAGTRGRGRAGLQRQVLYGHDEIVWALENFGDLLFTASADKTIRVWDALSRRCIKVLEGHTRPVLSLTIADGKLFSGSYDHSIKAREGPPTSRRGTPRSC